MHCCVLMCVCFLVVKKGRQESVSDSSEKGKIVLKICDFLSVFFFYISQPVVSFG